MAQVMHKTHLPFCRKGDAFEEIQGNSDSVREFIDLEGWEGAHQKLWGTIRGEALTFDTKLGTGAPAEIHMFGRFEVLNRARYYYPMDVVRKRASSHQTAIPITMPAAADPLAMPTIQDVIATVNEVLGKTHRPVAIWDEIFLILEGRFGGVRAAVADSNRKKATDYVWGHVNGDQFTWAVEKEPREDAYKLGLKYFGKQEWYWPLAMLDGYEPKVLE